MPDEPITTATIDHDLDQPLIIICQLESDTKSPWILPSPKLASVAKMAMAKY
jgi:uncharacterized protein involved in type VI secretion and phage assembly